MLKKAQDLVLGLFPKVMGPWDAVCHHTRLALLLHGCVITLLLSEYRIIQWTGGKSTFVD